MLIILYVKCLAQRAACRKDLGNRVIMRSECFRRCSEKQYRSIPSIVGTQGKYMCQVTKRVFSEKTHKQKDAQRVCLNGGLGRGGWRGER